MRSISIQRTRHRLEANARRVVANPFLPTEDAGLPSRVSLLLARIMDVPEAELAALNAEVSKRFDARHRDFSKVLRRQFELVADRIPDHAHVSSERQRFIGACFTHEYSIEAAALFNPSIVAAPDQQGLASGSLRFIMSLRAVGEGHVSSIEFRGGVIDATGAMTIDAPGARVETGRVNAPARFGKSLLASSNYVTAFPADSELAERVIFPAGPNETRGMEDARFVRFTESDGSVKYYATNTAYDDVAIPPQLIETQDFLQFRVSTLNGAAAQNKGMALFPRRVDGKYVMLSRRDRENLHLSVSNEMHRWDDVVELYRAQNVWEILQLGNCGSPIETEAGWLVLTHGVGPMRRYAIGALLLDLHDPRRVIGFLKTPLIEPDESEREGYVPNVVYTCGAIVHAQQLIIPYGYSDSGIAVAQLALSDLLELLLESQPPRPGRAQVAA